MGKILNWLRNLFFNKMVIKGLMFEYDKPYNGTIFKKGCFENIHKNVSIKYNDKKIGKGEIKDTSTGIYIEGYITDSEIKNGIKIIKDFELTGVGIFNPAFIKENKK